MQMVFILIGGTIAMLIPLIISAKQYNYKIIKAFPIAVALTVAGTIGTVLLFYLENGSFRGYSFYGAVFFIPIVFPVVSKLLRIPYGDLMDMCAPAECVMLAIMKVQCLVEGCCSGRVISYSAEGIPAYFPSQLVEFLNAWLVFSMLLVLIIRQKRRGKIYPCYLLIYGILRFVLNWFRMNQTVFFLGMPPGNFWSVCAIVTGFVWLYLINKRKNKA